MSTDPIVWRSALRDSQDALAAHMAHLGPERFVDPSFCDDWTVAAVLSHLGSQAELFSMLLEAGLAGTEVPGPESFPAIWDRWNALEPSDQVSQSLAANEKFVDRLEALSAEELGGVQLAMFGMDLDASGLLRMRLAEHALHSWDVVVMDQPTARVLDAAVDLLVDEKLGQIVNRVAKPQGKDVSVRIRTTGPEGDFFLSVGEEVAFETYAGQPVQGTLVISAEALLRLVYGRLDGQHTADFSLDGPVDLDDLRAIFGSL